MWIVYSTSDMGYGNDINTLMIQWFRYKMSMNYVFLFVNLIIEMPIVHGQQHLFSAHERMFLCKCRSFWDKKMSRPEGDSNPQPSMTNALTIWAIGAGFFLSHVLEHWLYTTLCLEHWLYITWFFHEMLKWLRRRNIKTPHPGISCFDIYNRFLNVLLHRYLMHASVLVNFFKFWNIRWRCQPFKTIYRLIYKCFIWFRCVSDTEPCFW